MAATITLPEPLAERSERIARELGMSQDELVEAALRQYVESLPRPENAALQQQFDAVYAHEDSSLDPVLSAIQTRSTQQDEW